MVWEMSNGIHAPLVRGISEMGVGIILCTFAHSRYNNIHNSVWLDWIAVVMFVFTFGVIFILGASEKPVWGVLLIFPLIIFSGMCNKGFLYAMFNHGIWLKLGGITYEMYLIHGVLGGIAKRTIEGFGYQWNICFFIIYAIVVTVISFTFKNMCQWLQCKF